jgi:hypothetical protein
MSLSHVQAMEHFNICVAEHLQGPLCTLWTHLALFPAPYRDHLPRFPRSDPPPVPDRAASGRLQPFFGLLGTRNAAGERPMARVVLASGWPSNPITVSAPGYPPYMPCPALMQPYLFAPWASTRGAALAPSLADHCSCKAVRSIWPWRCY